MVFRFEHPDKPVDDNIRRAAKGEFDRAIAEVSETGFEVHGTVRNVRRRLKRVRSILRLIRPVFPDFKAENAALRDTGAEVSALRDAIALVEAVDRLATGRDGDAGAALERLRRALAERAAGRESELDRETFLTGLRSRLRDARVRSELWELTGTGRRAVVPGFVDTYRRARNGLSLVEAERSEESFHEWREAVKHHLAQLSLLRGLAPAFAEGRRAQAAKLAQTLGDLQNLCVLKAALADDTLGISPSDKLLIGGLVADEIAEVSGRALGLGRPLFAETPQEVKRRWEAYWDDWQAASRLR